MSTGNCLSSDPDSQDHKLVRAKLEFQSLLQHAGATKEVFTIKEVMFYLGQYIMQKQLYDPTQQHIVHCSHDALGQVLGVDSFSVKEPRVLFAMITKNLVAVKNQESSSVSEQSSSQPDMRTETAPPSGSRRRRRSSDPGPSCSAEAEEGEDEEQSGGVKRRRSDSYSLTFDESLSWCVIGGLGSDTERLVQASDAHSTSGSDNFSVEFEVESIDSDDYSDDNASVSGDDQVYEVTIFEADEEDSSDEDTEITEADYWRCVQCQELNPPLPRNCNRCWALRRDWLPELSLGADSPSPAAKILPPKPCADQSEGGVCVGAEESEGLDVPDGKKAESSQEAPPWSQEAAPPCDAADPPSCSAQPRPPDSPPDAPQLERSVSLESFPAEPLLPELRLPESCLEPCVICQSRPKNGCIVHGRTGHLMACYTCARKLQRRNKLCPVCREPIQGVVLTYLS